METAVGCAGSKRFTTGEQRLTKPSDEQITPKSRELLLTFRKTRRVGFSRSH